LECPPQLSIYCCGMVDTSSPPSVLTAEELASQQILSGVDFRTVTAILQHCPMRKLKAGDWLLTKGQPNRRMYFMLSGKLGIFLDEPNEPPLIHVEPGQTVGEMSVLDGSPASAHVIAIDASRLLEVDDRTFWNLVSVSHRFSINLLQLLAQRMRHSNMNLRKVTLLGRELQRDAHVDPLTTLYNRRWWDDKFTRLVERAQRSKQSLGLLVLDIDHFKTYNDRYGHIAGDAVLKHVGMALLGNLRSMDLAARIGGEEFVIALPMTDEVGARAAAERLRLGVKASIIEAADGERLPQVTISIGVAVIEATESAPDFFARADAALYRAKGLGRDRVES
jgi:diguanylate cyclase (GGDEF)-like protein